MPWTGPYDKGPNGGISQSLLNRFIEDPYRFYIYAILGLQADDGPNENLMWGDTFHVGLEWFIKTKDFKLAKEKMLEYLAENYPQAAPSFAYTLPGMLKLYKPMDGEWETEVVFDEFYATEFGPVRLRGKLDGISNSHPQRGSALAEHKCKGYIDPLQTKAELNQDLQCNLYMYLHELEWVYYDLILIPESQKYAPKQKYSESIEAYVDRLFCGPCGNYNKYPIHTNRHEWIHQQPHFISRESQEDYWNYTILPLINKLCQFWEHVNQDDFDHENPAHYNHLFYRTPVRHFNGSRTEKFKCNYHAHLIGEQDLSELKQVESYFGELDEA